MNIHDYGRWYLMHWEDKNDKSDISNSIYIPKNNIKSKEELLALMPPRNLAYYIAVDLIKNNKIIGRSYYHSYWLLNNDDCWHPTKPEALVLP